MVNLLLDRNQDIETRDEVRLMRLAQNPHPLTNQGRCWTQPKQSAMGKQVGQPKEEGGVEAEQQTGQKLPEEESQSALHKAAQQGRGILLMSPIVLGGGGGEGDKQRMNVGR